VRVDEMQVHSTSNLADYAGHVHIARRYAFELVRVLILLLYKR
jgi:hypothetical protein